MTHFPALYVEAEKPDIIEETASGTYLGWFDRKEFDRSSSPETQPIWRIRYIAQADANGVSTTKILYPNGRDEYSQVWNDRESLTYNFRM